MACGLVLTARPHPPALGILPAPTASFGAGIVSADIFCFIIGSPLPLQHFLGAGQASVALGHP